MKYVLTLTLACVAIGCAAAGSTAMSPDAQGRLDRALAQRTAGPAVDCVSERDLRSHRAVTDDAILFEANGGTLYLNRLSGGCEGLGHGRAFRTTTPVSRLCRGDIITVFDPVSGSEYGGCSLGEFVPYRRAQ